MLNAAEMSNVKAKVVNGEVKSITVTSSWANIESYKALCKSGGKKRTFIQWLRILK